MAEVKIIEPPHLITDLKTLCLATAMGRLCNFPR